MISPPSSLYPIPPAVNLDLWVLALSPRWHMLSAYSSHSSIVDFASKCAQTGTSPQEYRNHVPAETISRKTRLSLPEAAIVYASLSPTSEMVEAANDLENQHRAFGIDNASFLQPFNHTGTYEEISISTGGIQTFLSVERNVHIGATIPGAFLLTETFKSLKDRIALIEEGTNVVDPSILLSMLTFFVLLFSVVTSIVQIWISSQSKLSDRAAANYLTNPPISRFSNVVSFFFAVAVLEPVRLGVLFWEENPDGEHVYFLSWVVLSCIFIILTVIYNGMFFIKSLRVYKNSSLFPECLERPLKQERLLSAIGDYKKRKHAEDWSESIRHSIAGKTTQNSF
jgi:hypothetical protein